MNIIEKVLEKYEPTVTENNMVKIVPLNRYEWRVVPIEENDNFIEISLDDFVCLTQRFAQFNETLTGVEDFNSSGFRAFITSKMNNETI